MTEAINSTSATTGETVSSETQCAAAEELASKASRPQWLRLMSFFFVLAVIAVVLNWLFNFGLRRIKTSEFGASNLIISGQVNAQIVINGSSRALVHYDPRIIGRITGESTYNLGRNAAQTDMQLAFLKTYLRHNVKPLRILQNLDPYSFVLTREVYDPAQYLPYLNEPTLYEPLRKINPAAWKWKYIPLYGYAVEDMNFTWIKALKGVVGLNPREDYFLGYNPRDLQWTGDFERFQAQHTNGVRLNVESEGVQLLVELVETCQNDGIQVILVLSPEYIGSQTMSRNREEVVGRFQKIAEQFRTPFWDYSQSDICRNQSLFYNSQHMNRAGAELFSAEIARRLAALPDRRVSADSGEKAPLTPQKVVP